MDLLLKYSQEKSDKKSKSSSVCNLILFGDENNIRYESTFILDFHRYGSRKNVIFNHVLEINLLTGDFNIVYTINNCGLKTDNMFKSTIKNKKNDFKQLMNLLDDGFYRGEKRKDYWGIKYKRTTERITNIITEKFKNRFINDYFKNKDYKSKNVISELYDIIVDFHLDCKKIKGHNSVYLDIQEDYPKKKWLKKNNNKFLPSILDYYGIKSKYLIGELSKNISKPIYLKSLNYLCKLFGEEYINYIKKVPWYEFCYQLPPNNKKHVLKNESEKKFMIGVMLSYWRNPLQTGSLINDVNRLLSLREILEVKGLDLKFKANNSTEFEHLESSWTSIKSHFTKGFKIKYTFDDNFVKTIEKDILVDDIKYKPKILVTEDDFRVEGFQMGNCMSKQFTNGMLFIYISLQSNRRRINLQYRNGELNQSYGKSNNPVPEIFNDAVKILNNRMSQFKDIKWYRERYDFIIN